MTCLAINTHQNLVIIIHLFLDWTAAELLVDCPRLCPLDTATFTCMDSNIRALQWRLWDIIDGESLATLATTSEQPERLETVKGVLFTAERSETALHLFFKAKLQTGRIGMVCENIVTRSQSNCNSFLSGE